MHIVSNDLNLGMTYGMKCLLVYIYSRHTIPVLKSLLQLKFATFNYIGSTSTNTLDPFLKTRLLTLELAAMYENQTLRCIIFVNENTWNKTEKCNSIQNITIGIWIARI